MKTLGLIGGIGPESTIEYYRLIVAGYRERMEGAYPPVIINSIDLKRVLALVAAKELEELTDYLVGELEKLVRAGAQFAALASNTPHVVFDALRQRSSIPLVSIVEAACQKIQSLGLKTVGLFGTLYTMQATFYPEVFAHAGIGLITPNEEEQTYIHDKYMNELLNNRFLPETKARILSIVDALKTRHGIEGLVLGGTELPLLLTGEEHNGILLLDTTRIHVEVLLNQLLD